MAQYEDREYRAKEIKNSIILWSALGFVSLVGGITVIVKLEPGSLSPEKFTENPACYIAIVVIMILFLCSIIGLFRLIKHFDN